MKFHNITKDDMLNGDGLRVVLWVSGCSHYCEDCQNKITWDPNVGVDFDEKAKQEIFDELEKDYIKGITFSGGDPLYSSNVSDVLALAKEIRKEYPTKDIWLYTGYTLVQLLQDDSELGNLRKEVLKTIDVLVDGEFMKDKKNISLQFRGSENQRLIDLRKTEEAGGIVWWKQK